MKRISRHIITCLLLGAATTACHIQPPLHLADDEPSALFGMGEVVTDIHVIWDEDSDRMQGWWYGWDDTDRALWGEIAYPTPSNYEGRFYVYGETAGADWQRLDKQTIYSQSFRRSFPYGYHDMLLWSNIDSPDGTQALIVDETDPNNIVATTSPTRVGFGIPPSPSSRANSAFNNPEIFYSGAVDGFYISRNPADYDYFDVERNAWVKKIDADLYPRVYIFLVQIAIYNNRGRIVALNDNAVVDALAGGVDIHRGSTLNSPVATVCEMRLKNGLPARNGRIADIFGGKLHTFGLCDMDPWQASRSRQYSGSRTDLSNRLLVDFQFSNSADSTFIYDITPQLRRQAHGGIITIEIDADTITLPSHPGSHGAGGFDAVIDEYTDSIEHIFNM